MSSETPEHFQCKFPIHLWLIYLTCFLDESSQSRCFTIVKIGRWYHLIAFFFAFSRGCFHFSKIYHIRLVKQALQQLYCEKRENTRFHKPKLKYYNINKTSHSLENYAKNYSSRLKLSTLAQFQGGIHPIIVEIGHFRNISPESRLCVLCNSNLVKD